jgi:hypothetical protein
VGVRVIDRRQQRPRARVVRAGGNVLGRLVTVRTLVRGAMAGLTLLQAARQSGLLEAPPARAPARRSAVPRTARKRPMQKKSRPV